MAAGQRSAVQAVLVPEKVHVHHANAHTYKSAITVHGSQPCSVKCAPRMACACTRMQLLLGVHSSVPCQ